MTGDPLADLLQALAAAPTPTAQRDVLRAVADPDAILTDEAAQDQFVPMVCDFFQRPHGCGDRLVAHLLGNSDAIGLHFPVCVVRADADIEPAVMGEDQRLDLTARLFAACLYGSRRGQACSGNPVIGWRHGRPCHAERFQFADMVFHCLLVAAGPAGDDQRARVETESGFGVQRTDGEIKQHQGTFSM